eukprot:TRINITY_DN14360_c0_g1_i1.p1 TRINITY_DN14360_c0_g1~~TRINITY_DN14360_c0_g1_i1.p1  ORF type:complete len:271 (+),score=49.94 TRINITY_DN14360_c0_g1_i1:71-883(+)
MALSKMSAWDKHVKFLNDYKKSKEKGCKTDSMALREAYEFVSTGESTVGDAWGRKLAEAYCKRLYKEYALVDLSYYKNGKIGMRWRTESEVVSGKGQFQCATIKCPEKRSLITLEVPFRYIEHKQKKEALVKVRLCPQCNHKMQYHHQVKKNRSLGLEPPPDTFTTSEDTKNEQPIKEEEQSIKEEHIKEEEPEGPRRPEQTEQQPVTATASIKRPKIEPDDQNINEDVKKEAPPEIDREAERLAWAPKKDDDAEPQTDEFDDFLAEMFP